MDPTAASVSKPSQEEPQPEGSGGGHEENDMLCVQIRNPETAGRLAAAIAAKYMDDVVPTQSHRVNVQEMLARELYTLSQTALGFRTSRLPSRALARLQAFLSNLCLAVPEPPQPSGLTSRFRRSSMDSQDGDGGGPVQPQVGQEELEMRLEYYILSLWAIANASLAAERAKTEFRGNPEAAARAERTAMEALRLNRERTDRMRVEATTTAFAGLALAERPLGATFNVVQNFRPRNTLFPLLCGLACEMVGLPNAERRTKEKVNSIIAAYESQHSLFQSAEANAAKFLQPLVEEFVAWLRLNEESLVASCTTEAILSGIDPALRNKLKHQTYYSAEHFLQVFNEHRAQLEALPIPLHPLLEQSLDMAAHQAAKDMNRERFLLNGIEVKPEDCPGLLYKHIRAVLEDILAADQAAATADAPTQTSSEGPVTPVPHTSEGGPTASSAGGTPRSPTPGSTSSGGGGGGGGGSAALKPSRHRRKSNSIGSLIELGQDGDQRHHSLVKHLVMRTIHAASRTANGGDAFFIVQDLYGGDGVLVKQSAVTAPPIELDVALEGIVIRSLDSYEIYHEQEVVEATVEAHPLMLMQTTMSETIELPQPHVIREHMGRGVLAFEGDMGRMSFLDDGGDASGDEEHSELQQRRSRRFLSLRAVPPQRARKQRSRRSEDGVTSSHGHGSSPAPSEDPTPDLGVVRGADQSMASDLGVVGAPPLPPAVGAEAPATAGPGVDVPPVGNDQGSAPRPLQPPDGEEQQPSGNKL
mmetsp:Transcript_6272/g.18318  ORF Transcript_6272/g.18318 Transcript_6272/m.18318 type:complete len:757 (-) Transcript_6272:377-2647(-)